MGKHLSDKEKGYIIDNAATKSAKDIAKHLKRPPGSIAVWMSLNKLLKPKRPITNDSYAAKYIIKHFQDKTISEIAADLEEDYYRVYSFCYHRKMVKIKPKKEVVIPVIEKKTEPIKRWPAQYSNPDYSRMYL